MEHTHTAVSVQRPQNGQFSDVARLHVDGIQTGFLSQLGTRVLREIYEGIDASQHGGVLVAVREGAVVGYVSYAQDIRRLFAEVLLRKVWILTVLLLPSLMKPQVLKRVFETVFYPSTISSGKPKRREQGPSRSELLSIAVDTSVRDMGIGRTLVAALDAPMKGRQVQEYYVVTARDNDRANRFYRSCGFQQTMSFRHHGNAMIEYVKPLDRE